MAGVSCELAPQITLNHLPPEREESGWFGAKSRERRGTENDAAVALRFWL